MTGRAPILFTLGFVAFALLILVPAEFLLRWKPPSDIHLYMGENSPTSGHWRSHEVFGVTYRDWNAFANDYKDKLADYPPEVLTAKPAWAFFGNSFIHANGMLGDTLRKYMDDRVIFNLKRNELLYVRLAQVELLVENGFRPERIVFSVMPIDMDAIGKQPMETVAVNSHGGKYFVPVLPPAIPPAIFESCRLLQVGWIRTGWHVGNPRYNRKTIHKSPDPVLCHDLVAMFGRLAEITKKYQIPTTILFIPNYEQIALGDPCKLQDALTIEFKEMGFDILDVRDAFCGVHDPHSIFLPDFHFNEYGNHILAGEVLRHFNHPALAQVTEKESKLR